MSFNDNDPSTRGLPAPLPDTHDHAALLLAESLIHGLLERSMINVANAIEIVEAADSVQVEVAEAADGHGADVAVSRAAQGHSGLVEAWPGQWTADTASPGAVRQPAIDRL
jgi:hypothetical protein